MPLYTSKHLADILRDTVRTIEQGTDVSPDDPSLLELKRVLSLKIAALESEAQAEIVRNASPSSLLPPADSN